MSDFDSQKNTIISVISNSVAELAADLVDEHLPEVSDKNAIVTEVLSKLLQTSHDETVNHENDVDEPDQNSNSTKNPLEASKDDSEEIEDDLEKVLKPLSEVVQNALSWIPKTDLKPKAVTELKTSPTNEELPNQLSKFSMIFQNFIKKNSKLSKFTTDLQNFIKTKKESKFKKKAVDLSNLRERQYLALWELAVKQGTPLNLKKPDQSENIPNKEQLQKIENLKVPNFKPLKDISYDSTEEILQESKIDKPGVPTNLVVKLKGAAKDAQPAREGFYFLGPNQVKKKMTI